MTYKFRINLFLLQFRLEAENKITDLQTCIRKLEEEKVDILSQLEDVQFRAEEETIIKSDIEVTFLSFLNRYFLHFLHFSSNKLILNSISK